MALSIQVPPSPTSVSMERSTTSSDGTEEMAANRRDERRVSPAAARARKAHRYYVSTAGRFRTVIDFSSLFAVIYCTIIVPYDMAFQPPPTMHMRLIDVVIEIFFLCEMCINFFTSYFDDTGEEVTQFSKMAIAYIKGWFIIDACSSVPGYAWTLVCAACVFSLVLSASMAGWTARVLICTL